MFVEHKEHGEHSRESGVSPITKLSQAIREGAKLRPQCSGLFFKEGKSCALGAAYEAITGLHSIADDDSVMALLRQRFKLGDRDLVWEVGMQRNDAGWTREQCADWLEKQGL